MSERMELLMGECPAWTGCKRKCMKGETCRVAERIIAKAAGTVLKCPRCGRKVEPVDKKLCQECRKVLREEVEYTERFIMADEIRRRVGGIGGKRCKKGGHQNNGRNQIGNKRDDAMVKEFGADKVRRMNVDERIVWRWLQTCEESAEPREFRGRVISNEPATTTTK